MDDEQCALVGSTVVGDLNSTTQGDLFTKVMVVSDIHTRRQYRSRMADIFTSCAQHKTFGIYTQTHTLGRRESLEMPQQREFGERERERDNRLFGQKGFVGLCSRVQQASIALLAAARSVIGRLNRRMWGSGVCTM